MAASTLPPLPTVERLSPRVIRILGGNPGKFTLQGTNTYLVGTGEDRILIDTAHGFEAWAKSLESVLASEGATISTCLLTHWHPDHVLGVPDLVELCPDVKIYKHKSSIPSLVEVNSQSSQAVSNGDQDDDTSGIHLIQDGQIFTTVGAKLTSIHSPGHTDDHIAFLLEDDEATESAIDKELPAMAIRKSDSGTVFSGDNVLGHGTTVFEDLALYLSSLKKMRHALQGPGMLYPAHGEVIRDGRGKIDEYIKHRKDREDQVASVLMSEREDEFDGKTARAGWTSHEITRVIYRGVDEGLLEAAERGVCMILAKWEIEGKVKQIETKWWVADKAKF